MSVSYNTERGTIELGAHCSVEEAENLLHLFLEHKEAGVDARACEHLHTAVLQVLMAVKPTCTEPPEDVFLQQLLTPVWMQ